MDNAPGRRGSLAMDLRRLRRLRQVKGPKRGRLRKLWRVLTEQRVLLSGAFRTPVFNRRLRARTIANGLMARYHVIVIVWRSGASTGTLRRPEAASYENSTARMRPAASGRARAAPACPRRPRASRSRRRAACHLCRHAHTLIISV